MMEKNLLTLGHHIDYYLYEAFMLNLLLMIDFLRPFHQYSLHYCILGMTIVILQLEIFLYLYFSLTIMTLILMYQ